MFAGLLHRAQATVDNAIGQIINRAIIAVPFLVAAGFATAYGFLRLNREYDAEFAALVMAIGFAILGLLTALVMRSAAAVDGKSADRTVDDVRAASTAEDSPAETAADSIADKFGRLAPADMELLIAALTTAAPIAMPGLLRVVVRNIPIFAALVAFLFIITRPSPGSESQSSTDAAA